MNAIEHSPAGESVPVALRFNAERARLEVSVEDRGPGVPQDEREAIFQKFRQGRGHSGGSGSGLGLAFCKMAVEAHHGTIAVAPREGGGSCFRVELPLLRMDGQLP
jgi:signal transduction histidine kinase